jgi:hypothetical protein
VLTYKSMVLTLWAKDKLGLGGDGRDLSPLPLDRFVSFFSALFSGGKPGQIHEENARELALWADRVLEEGLSASLQALLFSLIQELEEEYGSVAPDQVDPRFMPLFLIAE